MLLSDWEREYEDWNNRFPSLRDIRRRPVLLEPGKWCVLCGDSIGRLQGSPTATFGDRSSARNYVARLTEMPGYDGHPYYIADPEGDIVRYTKGE